MWDTRFSGWMPDFKLPVSHWILLSAEKFKFEALAVTTNIVCDSRLISADPLDWQASNFPEINRRQWR